MGLHRYWRVYVTVATAANVSLSIFEAEIRATVGGVDQCTGGVADASHSDTTSDRIFDDSAGTLWYNGAPSVDSWFSYDFGAGNDVDVGELVIRPQYSYSAPKDFKLEYSDNNVDWTEEQAWTGITSWSHNTDKFFTITPSISYAKRDWEFPYSINLDIAQSWTGSYKVGDPVSQSWVGSWAWQPGMQWDGVYGVSLGASWIGVQSISIGAAWDGVHSLKIGRSWVANQSLQLASSWSATIHYKVSRRWQGKHSINFDVSRAWACPYEPSETRLRDWIGQHSLLDFDSVKSSWNGSFDVRESDAPIIFSSMDVYLTKGSKKIELLGAEIGMDEGDFAWTGKAEIADAAGFQSLAVDDAVTLTMGGNDFAVLIDFRVVARSNESTKLSVGMISLTASLARPRASGVDLAVNVATSAKDATESAVGQAVSWDMLNWIIPGGRISFTDASPIDIAKVITGAAGGVIETNHDGTLQARHKFPVRVPDWNTTTPDHIVTDTTIFSINESFAHINLIDKVVVLDRKQLSSGRLSIEPDDRLRGLNRGGVANYISGGHVHMLVHTGPEITGVALRASAGELWPDPPQEYQDIVDLVFSDVDSVTLPRPVRSVDSWKWLGDDLGTLSLASDGVTVSVGAVGLSVARVTVTMQAYAWKVIAPKHLNGERRFPIALVATANEGDLQGSSEIIVQRNEGLHQGDDIIEPLASTVNAKRERGRAEIDAGEPLRHVTVECIFDATIFPGQLVEVQDALMGKTWRGKVTGARHSFASNTAITTLEMVRHVVA